MPIMRYLNPERPETYHDLPGYERRGYWRAMSRAVRVLSKDVIEFARFPDQRIRGMMFFLVFVALSGVLFGIYRTDGSIGAYIEVIKRDYQYVFHFEEGVREQYQNRVDRGIARLSEEEFVTGMMNSDIHSNRFMGRFFPHILYLSFPIMPLPFILFWPRACPIRFDRKRELAYTWDKGHLYIANANPFADELMGRITSEADGHRVFDRDKSTGAFGIIMMRADGGGPPRFFSMGVYPVCHADQNLDILMLIQAFCMSPYMPDSKDNNWLDKLKHRGGFFPRDILRWQSSRTLGKKHNFNEVKTEAALQEYLDRHNAYYGSRRFGM